MILVLCVKKRQLSIPFSIVKLLDKCGLAHIWAFILTGFQKLKFWSGGRKTLNLIIQIFLFFNLIRLALKRKNKKPREERTAQTKDNKKTSLSQSSLPTLQPESWCMRKFSTQQHLIFLSLLDKVLELMHPQTAHSLPAEQQVETTMPDFHYAAIFWRKSDGKLQNSSTHTCYQVHRITRSWLRMDINLCKYDPTCRYI